MKKLIKKIIICVAMSFLVVLMIYNFKTPKIAKAYDSKDDFSYFYDEPNHKLTFNKNDFSNDIDIGDYILYKVTKDNGSYFYVYDNIIDNQNIYDISFHDCLDLGIKDKFDDVYLKIIYLDNDKYDVFLSKIDSLKFNKLFTNAIEINFESDEGKKLIERAFYDEKAGLRDVDVPVCYDLNAYEEARLLTDSDTLVKKYIQNANTKYRDDDDIINLVPKSYFYWVGHHEYDGMEYKFFIDTTAESSNDQKNIKYFSKVTIIDYDINQNADIKKEESDDKIINYITDFLGGYYCEYYCYFKNDASEWESYGFNPYKDIVVRSKTVTENLEMRYFSNSYELKNENNNFCSNSYVRNATISIVYDLTKNTKVSNFDLISFIFSKIMSLNDYTSAYYDIAELIVGILDKKYEKEFLDKLYDLSQGIVVDDCFNVKAKDNIIEDSSQLIDKTEYLPAETNNHMIVANGFDFEYIKEKFGLSNARYRVDLTTIINDYKLNDTFINGKTYIFTNHGLYSVDFKNIKLEYNFLEKLSNNSHTDFNGASSYAFKYTIYKDIVLSIRTNADFTRIGTNNATWIKVFDHNYKIIYYCDGISKNNVYYSGNASCLINFKYNSDTSENNVYYIQTGYIYKSNINYDVLINEPQDYTNNKIYYSASDNIRYFRFTRTEGSKFGSSFYTISAISPTTNCDTFFEVYSSKLIRKAYDIDGLWEDNGDDESNMNAYKENIKMINDNYYYIKVVVSPRYGVFGNVILNIDFRREW